MTRKFELYDRANNYYYGKIKDNGKIELYDRNNNYYYGKLKTNGKIVFYDRANKYYGSHEVKQRERVAKSTDTEAFTGEYCIRV